MGTFSDLIVYKKAYELAMKLFQITRQFPSEEKYSLTSQVGRSSRAVCANLAEGYRKRQYPAHFVAKISDADMENTETAVWLDFSLSCNYVDTSVHLELKKMNIEIGRLLGDMIRYPEKYMAKTETL